MQGNNQCKASHSYFVRTCFLWNKVPLSVLDIVLLIKFLYFCSAVVCFAYVLVVCGVVYLLWLCVG